MIRKKTFKVTRERAIQIAMNHNRISKDMAEGYTDSELKEVLKQASGRTYSLKADF